MWPFYWTKKSAYPGKNNHIEHFSQLAIWFQLIIIGRWSNCWWHESRRTITFWLSSIHHCLSIDDHLTCSTCDFSLSLSLSLSVFFECFYSICFFSWDLLLHTRVWITQFSLWFSTRCCYYVFWTYDLFCVIKKR